jgi:hypothetical protein
MDIRRDAPIGSDYDWRCWRCRTVSTTERQGDRVALPRGWTITQHGVTTCARCVSDAR